MTHPDGIPRDLSSRPIRFGFGLSGETADQYAVAAPDDFGRYVASTEAEFITELARDAVSATAGASVDVTDAMVEAAWKAWGDADLSINDEEGMRIAITAALATSQGQPPSAPCQWGGGNDCITCLTCGAEYDYRSQERPDCLQGQPPCAPGRVEEAEITAFLECLGRREPNDPRERIRRALEASRRLATPSPQELAPAAEVEAVPVAWDVKWRFKKQDPSVVYPGGGASLIREQPDMEIKVRHLEAWNRVDWYIVTPLYAHPRPSSRDEPDTALREALERARSWIKTAMPLVAVEGGSRVVKRIDAALARLAPSEPGNDGRARS